MLRILVVGLNFYPELISTGKYTADLASYLAGRGHAVRVITAPPYYPHWKIQAGYHAWQYRKDHWQRVDIQRCPLWVPRHPTGLTRLVHLASFAFSSLPALMAQLRWKPALVLCVAPTIMNAPFALAFARLSGAAAWLHVQDFELDAALNLDMLPARRLLYPLARAFERFLLTHFGRVSTISETMRLLCIQKGVQPERALLLPNWVDTKKIHPLPAPGSLRRDFNIPTEAFVALYHGNMGRKQGLELLLKAARLLEADPKILFVLCGEGSAKQELLNLAASLSNVRFLELQPEEKLNELVNLADVHLLPQLSDAADLVMPSKLVTMLASGRPVIAGACQGTQISRVLDTIGMVVQPHSAKALAEALIYLYNNPSERCRLGDLSRAYACQHLDREVILSQLNNLVCL